MYIIYILDVNKSQTIQKIQIVSSNISLSTRHLNEPYMIRLNSSIFIFHEVSGEFLD